MANLIWTKSKERQQRIPKNIAGAGAGRCRKHPKHRQSPGVCSACLRERLSQLPATSSLRKSEGFDSASTGSSSSLSSYSSSSSSCSSSRASPARRRRGGNGLSLSQVLKLGSSAGQKRNDVRVMRKSRSVAVGGGEGEGKEKKKGFWSVLRRRKEERPPARLGHSLTMRDVFLITTS
ncbi:unnamed protein product [Linum tenue]|uniref:Uncharacterized protein n=1 Tax=Linum tenue TaxID=586396 RepID=A0AAV0MNK3_9ROSI|nr:unnamed protein product [Linum tenue]